MPSMIASSSSGIANEAPRRRTNSMGSAAVGMMQPKNRKLSVSEMIATRERGGPQMSMVTDAMSGQRLTNQQATDRGPFEIGWNGGGRGRGYGGGMSRPRSVISSAGVAGGIPTSQRGRAELDMSRDPALNPTDAWIGGEMPAWQRSAMERAENPFGSNPRYGSMGRPMDRTYPGVRGYAEGTRNSGDKSRVAVVGEEGPETVVLPPGSKVLPNITNTDLGLSALQEILGEAGTDMQQTASDGEIRQDAQGNYWKYDAKQGRGIPMNPYMGNENAPSPDSFRSSAGERYQDLSSRLQALRQSGMAEGRAAVAKLQQEQSQDQARRDAFLATGREVPQAEGGGKVFNTPYGRAIVGGSRPKSFTVENWEGGQTSSPVLAEAGRESAADAAERRVRGLGTNAYRARPNAVPTALDEIVDVQESFVEEPEAVVEQPLVRTALPASRVGDVPTAVITPPLPVGRTVIGTQPVRRISPSQRFNEGLFNASARLNNAVDSITPSGLARRAAQWWNSP